MKKGIFYLHGAFSTETSWNYLTDQLEKGPQHVWAKGHYNIVQETINEIVERMVRNVEEFAENLDHLILVGHSIGGVIALPVAVRLTKNVKYVDLVSLSTPYGGVKLPWGAALVPPILLRHTTSGHFYHNVAQVPSISRRYLGSYNEEFIFETGRVYEHWAIITEGGGSPLISEPNDGAISVESQLCLPPTVVQVRVDLNHFEILMSPKSSCVIMNVLCK